MKQKPKQFLALLLTTGLIGTQPLVVLADDAENATTNEQIVLSEENATVGTVTENAGKQNETGDVKSTINADTPDNNVQNSEDVDVDSTENNNKSEVSDNTETETEDIITGTDNGNLANENASSFDAQAASNDITVQNESDSTTGQWIKTQDGKLQYRPAGSEDCYQEGFYTIDDNDYLFIDGYVVIGWYEYVQTYTDSETGETETYTNWYYAEPNGVLHKGWLQIDKKWYYFDPNNWGCMYSHGARTVGGKYNEETGLLEGGKMYFFTKNGEMLTGWCKEEYILGDGSEVWYYAKPNGELHKGWLKNDGKWYYLDPESYIMYSNGVRTVGGKYNEETGLLEGGTKYCFNKSGAMITGWYKDVQTYINSDGQTETWSEWYYAKSNGELHTGWLKSGGKWYYLNPKYGYMYSDGVWTVGGKCNEETGLLEGGTKYYFNKSGAMATGWCKDIYFKEDGSTIWYYAEPSGELHTGWLKNGGKWYYFDPESCIMYSDDVRTVGGTLVKHENEDGEEYWILEGGTKYCFNKSGAMVTGWYKDVDTWTNEETGETETYTNWYYAKSNGELHKGWLKTDGKWYYLDPEYGIMHSDGFETIGGKTYYLKASGEMATGWQKQEDTWYYFKKDGAMQEQGWIKTSGKWYYLDNSAMVSDCTMKIDGKLYAFEQGGAMVSKTGWVKLTTSEGSEWIYVDKASGELHTGWLTIKNAKYYLDSESGYMYANGNYSIDGKTYGFDETGACKGEL